VNNEIVYKGSYPERNKLAEICEIEWKEEYASQEAIPAGVAGASGTCGPECDCHQSEVSNKSKKIIFVAVLVIIVAILVFKAFCKAGAAELNTTKAKNAIHLVKNKKASSPKILGEYINSINQLNFAALKQDAAFIFIPAKNNMNMGDKTRAAAFAAQKALNAKKIKVGLYTLKPSSADYSSISSQTATPAILVVYKDRRRKAVSGEINETVLLQAYMATSIAGGCGSDCPCH
jgi:hypothetical protein